MIISSKFDQEILPITRKHIDDFIIKTSNLLKNQTGQLLEIGPQDRSMVKEYFNNFNSYVECSRPSLPQLELIRPII